MEGRGDDALYCINTHPATWQPHDKLLDINNWDNTVKPVAADMIQNIQGWCQGANRITEDASPLLTSSGVLQHGGNSSEMCPLDFVVKEEEPVEVMEGGIQCQKVMDEIPVVPDCPIDEAVLCIDISQTTTQPLLHGFETAISPVAADQQPGSTDASAKNKCSVCSKVLASRDGLTRHMKIHMDKTHVCATCSKGFTTKEYLKIHMRTHDKPFSCELCDYTCARKTSLTAHLQTHTGEKGFSCHLCDYTCTQKQSLTQHLRIKHNTNNNNTGSKPHSCPFCEYTCIQKHDLARHVRTHTGEKPFSCTYCERSFIDKQTLTIHLRIHTGEKPYTCVICGQSFSRNRNLKRHQLTHTGEKPHKCDCGIGFTTKASMLKHKLTHNREKPHKCDDCGQSFARKDTLTSHMQTHVDVKPHMCGGCGKMFRDKGSRNKHAKKCTSTPQQ